MKEIWTIGHSTLAWTDFLGLLSAYQIEVVADVRRFPGSRKHPQFNSGEMSQALAVAGVRYIHLPELGGRRTPLKDSANLTWRNDAFRGYADHMNTVEFHAGFNRLLSVAAVSRTAVMCAEAVWWRCHRGLLADQFKVDGWTVWHIRKGARPQEHPLTSAAQVIDGRLSYAPPTPLEFHFGETPT